MLGKHFRRRANVGVKAQSYNVTKLLQTFGFTAFHISSSAKMFVRAGPSSKVCHLPGRSIACPPAVSCSFILTTSLPQTRVLETLPILSRPARRSGPLTSYHPGLILSCRSSKVDRSAQVSGPLAFRRTFSSEISANQLLETGRSHVAKGLSRLTDAIITSGEGAYVNLHDGRRMLDFTSGIGVTNLGPLRLLHRFWPDLTLLIML